MENQFEEVVRDLFGTGWDGIVGPDGTGSELELTQDYPGYPAVDENIDDHVEGVADEEEEFGFLGNEDGREEASPPYYRIRDLHDGLELPNFPRFRKDNNDDEMEVEIGMVYPSGHPNHEQPSTNSPLSLKKEFNDQDQEEQYQDDGVSEDDGKNGYFHPINSDDEMEVGIAVVYPSGHLNHEQPSTKSPQPLHKVLNDQDQEEQHQEDGVSEDDEKNGYFHPINPGSRVKRPRLISGEMITPPLIWVPKTEDENDNQIQRGNAGLHNDGHDVEGGGGFITPVKATVKRKTKRRVSPKPKPKARPKAASRIGSPHRDDTVAGFIRLYGLLGGLRSNSRKERDFKALQKVVDEAPHLYPTVANNLKHFVKRLTDERRKPEQMDAWRALMKLVGKSDQGPSQDQIESVRTFLRENCFRDEELFDESFINAVTSCIVSLLAEGKTSPGSPAEWNHPESQVFRDKVVSMAETMNEWDVHGHFNNLIAPGEVDKILFFASNPINSSSSMDNETRVGKATVDWTRKAAENAREALSEHLGTSTESNHLSRLPLLLKNKFLQKIHSTSACSKCREENQ